MPVVAWMLVISFASTDLMSAAHTSRFIGPFLRWLAPEISAASILAVQFFVRKAAHLTEYAILAALLLRALRPGRGKVAMPLLLWTLFIAAAYAMLDEFHQSFVTSRTGSPRDVMIDVCGAAVGLALYWIVSLRSASVPARSQSA